MDNYWFVLAGLVVGLLVGITGVGGGSLMTPILISLLKVSPAVAIGTDLLYAAVSKFFGTLVHSKKANINWKIVLWLSLGSIPASLLAHWLLGTYLVHLKSYNKILTIIIGVMLITTGLSILLRKQLEALIKKSQTGVSVQQTEVQEVSQKRWSLIAMGMTLGFFVTLSSVGAGAFGVLVLVLLLPQLPMIRIIGSDVAHAVLLTLVAGMGHLFSGNVDYHMLGWLLLGSIPATMIGVLISSRMPEQLIRRILGVTILLLGINFIVHPSKPKAEHFKPAEASAATQAPLTACSNC